VLARVLLAMVLAGGERSAEGVQIAPAVVEISPERPYADFRVGNLGSERREVLTEVFSWTQDARGRVSLARTDAVSAYPPRVELAPGEERRFRLTVIARAPIRPSAYRIGVTVRDLATGEQVTALVPAFVLPEHPTEVLAAYVDCVGASRCRVILENRGNVALRPVRILLALHRDGAQDIEGELEPWWVLPAETREWDVPVAASAAREVHVRVKLLAHDDVTAWASVRR